MPAQHQNLVIGSKPKIKASASETTPHDYWTPERRAAAIPVPLPKEARGDHKATAAESSEHATGDPDHLAPGHPKNHSAHKREKKDHSDNGGVAVAHPLSYPYSTCGKLFFSQGGKDFSGSASVVAPNILLTAGHCVHKGGVWSTNVTFYPSYPVGKIHFSYSYLAAWTAWVNDSKRDYDYGMIWIDNDPGHKVGWLGLLWNAATAGRSWDAVGYPATPNPPFNGNTMDETVGKVASSSVAGTIGLTNDNMEHGSSGGPWITDFNGSPREYANGLQSFHNKDGDFTEFGPYFTADVKGLYDWISNPANRH